MFKSIRKVNIIIVKIISVYITTNVCMNIGTPYIHIYLYTNSNIH